MTTVIITTYNSTGSMAPASGVNVDITPKGGFGYGIYAKYNLTIVNEGRVNNYRLGETGLYTGVELLSGGSITNGSPTYTDAVVEGAYGVKAISGAGSVMNFGTIRGLTSAFGGRSAVILDHGGGLTNGSTLDQTALVEGDQGIVVGFASGYVANFGTILAQNPGGAAVQLNLGGTVTNGNGGDVVGLIRGGLGVDLGGTGSVANFGAIVGSEREGVALYAGGNVTNGAAADNGASIGGYFDGVLLRDSGTVVNYGAISASGAARPDAGVELESTGAVTNGSTGDVTARIQGGAGVNLAGAGSVANFGAIVGSADQGVVLYSGGNVTNGAVTDTGASITGDFQGVGLVDAGTVRNFGAISGTGAAKGNTGVQLNAGGFLFNGASTDLKATVTGYAGALMSGFGTVINYGTVKGLGAALTAYGVGLIAGGDVYNGGSGLDRTALITGESGVVVKSGLGVILNAGTILGSGDFGAELYGGGHVVNGSPNNSAALIQGYTGLGMAGGSAINYGIISGAADYGVGVAVESGATIINGHAGHAGALIEGWEGVDAQSGSTVTNFGTIEGSGGTAVQFTTATGVLNVEAGSRFIGAVRGAGATLVLASGAGTIVLAGAALTVSGSMVATTFSGFDTVRIPTGASFKVSGNNTGTLVVLGGTLTSDGTVSGTGRVNINGGVADMGAGFEEPVYFTATTGELELGASKTYTGKINGFSKTGTTSLDLLDIAFAGTTTGHYSGTATSGVLTVTEGANTAKITLEGNYLSSTFTLAAAPGGGTRVVDPTEGAAPAHVVGPAPAHQFIAAMAGFDAPKAGSIGLAGEIWRTPAPSLAAPAIHLA